MLLSCDYFVRNDEINEHIYHFIDRIEFYNINYVCFGSWHDPARYHGYSNVLLEHVNCTLIFLCGPNKCPVRDCGCCFAKHITVLRPSPVTKKQFLGHDVENWLVLLELLKRSQPVSTSVFKSTLYETFPLFVAIRIDTNIEVIVVSLTTWEAHHSPRDVNETTITEIGVSISILSWWDQINDE